MPITMELRDSGRVLYIVMTDPWEGKELAGLLVEVSKYLDQVQWKVHTFVEAQQARNIPRGPLNEVLTRMNLFHANRGTIVMVGLSGALQALTRLAFGLYHFDNYKLFDKPDLGWVYLGLIMDAENRPIVS